MNTATRSIYSIDTNNIKHNGSVKCIFPISIYNQIITGSFDTNLIVYNLHIFFFLISI